MNFRDKLALNVAPLTIRLALALTFVWAGASKIFHTDTVTGADAAALANLGIIAPPSSSSGAPAANPPSSTPPAPAQDPSSAGATPLPSGDTPDSSGGVTFTLPTAPAATPAALRLHSAAEFPGNTAVSRRHTSITLTLFNAAQPDSQGNQLWPGALSSPVVLRTLAWLAPLAEFGGGFLVLMGFLTRLSAISLAGTMMVAMLLTTIGPAIISPGAFLGFLPQPRLSESGVWVGAWTPMLFQFTLLMASCALVLSGPGALSLDRLVFGGRAAPGGADSRAEDDGDDDD